MTDRPLQTENAAAIRGFAAVNFALFLAELGLSVSADNPDSLWHTVGILAPWATVTPVVVTILLGVLPAGLIESLIFLRRAHALPSYRAFTYHAAHEPLADPRRLRDKLTVPTLPSDPVEQHRAWYRLYQMLEDRMSVRSIHGRYLLMRDVAALALLSIVILWPVVAVIGRADPTVVVAYLGLLLIQCLAAGVAARAYAVRLVRNVLAVAAS